MKCMTDFFDFFLPAFYIHHNKNYMKKTITINAKLKKIKGAARYRPNVIRGKEY